MAQPGHALGSNAELAAILAANPNAWTGKTYRHTISGNCCIVVSDGVENYGMSTDCNSAGPFAAGQPGAGESGCTGQHNNFANQLTACVN